MEVKMKREYFQRASRKSRRYSEAFKRKVVSDVNEGLYSAWRAMQIYKIGGKNTVYKWLAKYSPDNVFTIRRDCMKKKKEGSTVDLKSRIRYLEQIVSDLTIEKKILETTIEIANETYGLDLKKNIGNASLGKSIKKTIKRSHSEK
jgi:transposase-like protein